MEKIPHRPRSFTLTDAQYDRMKKMAVSSGLSASELLRRWIIAQCPDEAVKVVKKHLSSFGGNPDPTHRNMWNRLGKCNPDAVDYQNEPCALCWPNGTPKAMRDNRGNIVSWTLDEVVFE